MKKVLLSFTALLLNYYCSAQSSPGEFGGILTLTPESYLRVNSNATLLNPTTAYSGNFIIQGNNNGRSSTSGASLEFAIPANTDGSNPWGQARIITIAGNNNTYNATGKLILGTRRTDGVSWNYGNDLVIDGAGNVGVGTLTPDAKLSVAGNIQSREVKVTVNAGADFVFAKEYNLKPLTEIEKYIDLNKHLPGIASAEEMKSNGLELGEMNIKLLQKIEELTLHLIEKDKEIAELKTLYKKIAELSDRVDSLSK